MAKSVLDILIRTVKQGGGDNETIKSLYRLKQTIHDTAAVAGAFVVAGFAVKKILDETIAPLVAYANEVRRIQDATGASAEDSSKLIQVLDDMKVSYEQLEKAVAKSGKQFDFSIDGIANMSDEYLALGDSQKQAAYMQERFGKQWISFVPVMKQGGQAIRDASDAVDDSLVLTQKAVDQARKYEIAVDNWNDSVQALKISIGSQLLPVLTDFTNMASAHSEAMDRAREAGATYHTVSSLQYQVALKQVMAEKEAAAAAMIHSDATDENTESVEENAEALKELTKVHQDMLGLIGKVYGAEQSYQETSKSLAEERIKIEDERAAALAAGWWEGSEKIRDFDAALVENGQKAEENAAKHHEAMGKIQYDLLITKLSAGGLEDAEFLVAQQAGLMFGVFDQESVEAAKNMDLVAQAVDNGTLKVDDMKRALDLMKKGYSIDVVLNVLSNFQGSFSASQTTALGNQSLTRTGRPTKKAAGTKGWETVPPGYPNDTFPVLMTSGEQFAVIPAGGGAASSYAGAASGGVGDTFYINLTISSPVTIMDEQQAQNTLLPYIINGVRQARAQGAIK